MSESLDHWLTTPPEDNYPDEIADENETRRHEMATAKNTRDFMTSEVRDETRQTSISAHTVLSVSVNMSMIEMDTLIGTFGRMRDELSQGELTIQDEFTHEVDRVRFTA